MKHLLTLFLVICGTLALAQGTLDLAVHSECELFAEKNDFDRKERLKQIKNIEGQFVTVYLVRGKSNKIKSTYSGYVDLKLINIGESSLKNMTSVLIVTEDKGNGRMVSHLPLTDVNYFRIYLTECIGQ